MVTVVLSDGKGLLQVNRRALLHLSKTPRTTPWKDRLGTEIDWFAKVSKIDKMDFTSLKTRHWNWNQTSERKYTFLSLGALVMPGNEKHWWCQETKQDRKLSEMGSCTGGQRQIRTSMFVEDHRIAAKWSVEDHRIRERVGLKCLSTSNLKTTMWPTLLK